MLQVALRSTRIRSKIAFNHHRIRERKSKEALRSRPEQQMIFARTTWQNTYRVYRAICSYFVPWPPVSPTASYLAAPVRSIYQQRAQHHLICIEGSVVDKLRFSAWFTLWRNYCSTDVVPRRDLSTMTMSHNRYVATHNTVHRRWSRGQYDNCGFLICLRITNFSVKLPNHFWPNRAPYFASHWFLKILPKDLWLSWCLSLRLHCLPLTA